VSALTVLLIRHAEKPPEKAGDPDFGPGLSAKGKEDRHSLAIRGWQRAGAWAVLFAGGSADSDYPRPKIVYAADPNPSPEKDGPRSRRAFETIHPLCKRLQIDPVTTYGVGHEHTMIEEVKRLTGSILICWEHNKIVESIIPKIVADQKLPHLPTHWHGDRFDVVLRLDRAQAGAPWKFRQQFPQLLSGDLSVTVEQKA
jgi:hypothetical protein